MIEFSNPAALWLLTLMVPIILLYLLKRKRKDVRVPSLLIWKKAIEDSQAQTPFQKLRSNILLFLQILILVLITALLADPHASHQTRQTMRWILVLDTSASMQATDQAPSRFESARQRLIKLLDSIPASDEVMLVSFSLEASVIQPFSSNHESVRARIQGLRSEDVGSDWSRLTLILKPLLKQIPKPRIVIASDFSGCPSNLVHEVPFESIAVGSSDKNMAVTRAALRPSAENPPEQTLFYQIMNLSAQPQQADVELYSDKNLIDAARFSLKAHEQLDRSRQFSITQQTVIEIRITNRDDLGLDNDFVLYAEPVEPLQIQVDYKNPFLIRALGVLPSARISEKAGVRIIRSETLPDDETAGIIFLTAPSSSPSSEVVQWSRTHAALNFVDAGLWSFSHCRRLEAPSGSEVLLETHQGPAAYAVDHRGKRQIVLGFDLDQSNIAGFAGFPIFLQNSLEWIGEGVRQALPTLTGEETSHEGILEVDGRTTYLNFADAAESAIAPRRPASAPLMEKETIKTTRSLAPYFLLLLIVMVMLEWWAFHRRMDSV